MNKPNAIFPDISINIMLHIFCCVCVCVYFTEWNQLNTGGYYSVCCTHTDCVLQRKWNLS